MTISKRLAPRTSMLLLAVLFTGIYSCNNNATGDKKADTSTSITVIDSTKVIDTTKVIVPVDTTKPTPDSPGREVKVPRPR